jgi:hypothetical protein
MGWLQERRVKNLPQNTDRGWARVRGASSLSTLLELGQRKHLTGRLVGAGGSTTTSGRDMSHGP